MGRKIIRRSGLVKLERQIIKRSLSQIKEKDIRVEFIDSGSSTFNCAGSGGTGGCWARGRIINIVGDSSSGKTILALELAFSFFKKIKSSKSDLFPKVKKITIIYDNVEGVMDFPLEEMYGKDFVKAVDWVQSKYVEQWGRSVGRNLLKWKSGEAVLMIVDSLDPLKPEVSKARFKKAIKDDKESSHRIAEKAAYLSQELFGDFVANMKYKNKKGEEKNKDFTLVVVSQVRTKIGVVFGKREYVAGGNALEFHAHQRAWLGGKKLTKKVRGEYISFGKIIRIKFEKNKVAIPYREADSILLFKYGLDNAWSVHNFLYGSKEFEDEGLNKYIVKFNKNDKFRSTEVRKVQKLWKDIEDSVTPKRKPKYA